MSARRIPPNRRSITGLFPSLKNGCSVRFESSLERDNFLQLEFDDDVVAYEAQAIKLEFTRKNGRRYPGYPDVTVIRRAGSGPSEVQDVKFRAEIFEKWAHLKPRLRAACEFARREGKIYRLRSEVEIRTPALPQLRFLYGYLRQVTPSPSVASALLGFLAEHSATTPTDMLRACLPEKAHSEAIPTLWCLIAKRQICANLDSPLTMSTRIYVPV